MKNVRYSTLSLWMRYINRDSNVIGLVVLLLFGCFFAFFLVLVGRQLAFIANSRVVQATVIGKLQTRVTAPSAQLASISNLAHGKRGPRYFVLYEYVDSDGAKHTGRGSVWLSEWKVIQAGDPISVRYDTRDPAHSQLDDQLWNFWPALLIAAIGLFVGSLVVYFGVRSIVSLHRKIELLKNGDAIPGLITYAAVETRGTRRKSTLTVLKYEYLAETLQQHTLELVGPLRSNWKAGEGIVIVVDLADPTRHAPDIFDARRDDRMRLFDVHQ